MKLAFVTEIRAPTSILAWNTDDTAESLRDQGFPVESKLITEQVMKSDFDVFIFYRTVTIDSVLKMRELQSRGKLCGFFVDDLIWDPRFEFAYHPMYAKNCEKFFKEADFFVFTSERLAEVACDRFRFDTAKVFIRRPAILERRFYELVRVSERAREGGSVFKAAITKGHITKDFQVQVKEFIETIDQPAVAEVEVHYFSNQVLFPELGRSLRVIRHNQMDFDLYLRELAKIAPDVVVCPFTRNEFNDCKCYPKYLECGGIASAILVTDIVPYKKVVKHPDTGLLVTSVDSFSGMVSFAMKNRGWLREIGEACRRDVRENHLLGPVAREFYWKIRGFYETQRSR